MMNFTKIGGIQLNIGIIGGGAIATYLLEIVGQQANETMQVRSIFVRQKEKTCSLSY